jgi:hypothetical protein
MSDQKSLENDQTGHGQEDKPHPPPVPSNNNLKPEDVNNDAPALPSIGQVVLDRLNRQIEQEKLGVIPEPGKKHLEQIGRLIRTWRIKNGYVRADLAEKLKLEEDRLLCIERGIGLPEDITEEQLLALQSLLGTNELDRQLNALVQDYLTSLKT